MSLFAADFGAAVVSSDYCEIVDIDQPTNVEEPRSAGSTSVQSEGRASLQGDGGAVDSQHTDDGGDDGTSLAGTALPFATDG